MKNSQVKVGGTYLMKVGRNQVPVKIESTTPDGGWNATYVSSGKQVVVKSAERLTAMPASDAKTKARGQDANGSKSKRKTTGDKKLSCLDAAAKVLAETGEPLNTKRLVEAMAEKGYWTSPGGKTPHATLYSAILREINGKGAESRFVKSERGKFAHAS